MLFASYFSGIMARLMLTLTPCVCVLAGIAVSVTLDRLVSPEAEPEVVELQPETELIKPEGEEFYKNIENDEKSSENEPVSEGDSLDKSQEPEEEIISPLKTLPVKKINMAAAPAIIKLVSLAAVGGFLIHYTLHATYITKSHYSSPSIMLMGSGKGH